MHPTSTRGVRTLWEADGAQSVSLALGSCHADIDEIELDEARDEIRVTVWVRGGTSEDCADGTIVDLAQPVGDRRVVDGSSGEVVARRP
jgi:hypothetical protein